MDLDEYDTRAEDTIPCNVRMISGCEDTQTSADVSNVGKFSLPDPAGRAGGACTSALLNVMYNSNATTTLSFVELLREMRSDLRRNGFTQNPQLSSSRKIDLNVPFHLTNPEDGGDGTKRAVLIGINYLGQQGQLSGCHNNALNMKKYLISQHGFDESNMTVLLDDGHHRSPTRANIMSALEVLVQYSRSGDSVFVHYSGRRHEKEMYK